MSTMSPTHGGVNAPSKPSPAPERPLLEERRQGVRATKPYAVVLIRGDGARIGPCQADDFSEGGLHLTAPIGYGLMVGQRYEFQLADPESGKALDGLENDGQYATVVRTQILTDGPQDCVGVGLRFDQPLYLSPSSGS